jgi:hypothetical protein
MQQTVPATTPIMQLRKATTYHCLLWDMTISTYALTFLQTLRNQQ